VSENENVGAKLLGAEKVDELDQKLLRSEVVGLWLLGAGVESLDVPERGRRSCGKRVHHDHGVLAPRRGAPQVFDHLAAAKDLGNRAYLGDLSKSALERARVPDIGGFTTYRTDNVANLTTVGTVTGTTINGAQSFTPASMTGDVPTDNRQMVLNVSGANIANIKAGDSFTIANVNAVHQIDKSDTGQSMTFRVLSVAGGGANLTVTPALIASGPYQNVSASAAGGAAVTFLNTATKPVNAFWSQGAVSLDYGRLAFPTGEGPQVMTATTKQGVPLIMSYSFNHLTGKTTCRFTTLYATAVRSPEHCGIIVANQV